MSHGSFPVNGGSLVPCSLYRVLRWVITLLLLESFSDSLSDELEQYRRCLLLDEALPSADGLCSELCRFLAVSFPCSIGVVSPVAWGSSPGLVVLDLCTLAWANTFSIIFWTFAVTLSVTSFMIACTFPHPFRGDASPSLSYWQVGSNAT